MDRRPSQNATRVEAIVTATEPELSVVIPVFNEGANVEALVARLLPVLERAVASWEVVFVDDGSRDDTLERVRRINRDDPRFHAIAFSRNFGKEIAIAAGLDHARGRATVIMDADLQHPPELIETFVARWREGNAMVFGVRTDRDLDGPVRRFLAHAFYRLFASFGETPLPEGAGDFRLLDRRAVEALRTMGERARFSKGLYAWIGFKSVGVPFDVARREHGSSKFSVRKLFRFGLDGITSFSTVPLKLWTYVGAVISAFALLTAIFFVIDTLVRGADVPGYASLIVSVMFFSGVQLISLGVIGEYIGRIFAEVKRRPLYIVGDRIGFDDQPPQASSLRKVGSDRRRA
ncbi:glycosyltransferase family 2 protein [Alsobacter sp. SYSU M60028]|uniref:Glycosyltransferase family 2 protein n=1 Tax=Alsobacter ponti TaxID=2962936 RepID=A0ABT1L8H7_9HYPH|nr:glycosyltransferase family 2 protein [Alsobacter ponti]MCP8937816.1 glycosyltransferase family 2 protein [Alsobacter ponti]